MLFNSYTNFHASINSILLSNTQSEEDQYDVAVQVDSHDEYETLAQSVCTNMAVSKGLNGWTYAVRRVCSGSVTCDKMCASKFLHVQDRQTVNRSWKSLGALHVYKKQPSSNTNDNSHPKEGLKVYWSKTYQTRTRCGPNYCCCLAA